MFGSTFLDVLIGLFTIYLVVSIACSAFAEYLAGLLRWRAAMFRDTIYNLLTGQAMAPKGCELSIVQSFQNHSLIRSIVSQKNKRCAKKTVGWPSYLSPQTFSRVVMDLVSLSRHGRPMHSFWSIRSAVIPKELSAGTTDYVPTAIHSGTGNSNPPQQEQAQPTGQVSNGGVAADSLSNQPPPYSVPEISEHLRSVLGGFVREVDAAFANVSGVSDQRKLAMLHDKVEQWFEEAMARTAGWYKRHVQGWLLVLGLIAAVLLNLDTIAIMRTLYESPTARTALAAMVHSTAPGDAGNAVQVHQLVNQWSTIAATGLPVGWKAVDFGRFVNGPTIRFWTIISKLLGLLMTAFAVSLGAPFWFDTLGKLINIRNAGDKPPPRGGLEHNGDTGIAPIMPGSRSGGSGVIVSPDTSPATQSNASSSVLPSNYWTLPARHQDIQRFVPKPARYEPANSAFMARASMLAYQNEPTLTKTLAAAWGITDVKVVSAAGQMGFAAAADLFTMVVFRGTVLDDLNTIIADAEIALEPYPDTGQPVGRVHCGFRAAMDALKEKLDEFLALPAAAGKPLFITGHSLGAAMATLYVAHCWRQNKLANFQGLYTFGSPRVGDGTFVTFLDPLIQNKSYRFVNDQDVVTRVPPPELGYAHVRQVMYLDAQGCLDNSNENWIRFLNTAVETLDNYHTELQSLIKDHSIDRYVAKLDRLAAE
ncbi:MAG: lipase family protein [Planctomycetia bacterium]|nr:lipase family protein [Planctomycetia bacterium]